MKRISTFAIIAVLLAGIVDFVAVQYGLAQYQDILQHGSSLNSFSKIKDRTCH